MGKRWAISILLVVLVAVAALSTWKAVDTSNDLEDARLDAARLSNQAESLSNGFDHAREELAGARKEAGTTAHALRSARRELRLSQPCDDGPHIWVFPDSGPVGTRVRFVGDCFVSRYEDNGREVETSPYGIFLIRTRAAEDCDELIVFSDDIDVAIRDGRAEGAFTVGDSGGCFQTDISMAPPPGEYKVGIGCHACSTNATFRVTD